VIGTARTIGLITYSAQSLDIGINNNKLFPRFPNSGSSYVISDAQTFTYDSVGRMLTATNKDAKITRTYFRNGQLKTEQQEIANVDGGALGHSYLLQFTYDKNGRRRAVHLPSQLVVSGTRDSVAWTYNALSGLLEQATDPLGNTFQYTYTGRNEPQSLTYPGNYLHQWTYGPDGNMVGDKIVNLGGTAGFRYKADSVRRLSFSYDARGKVTQLADPFGLRDTITTQYSGLGFVVSSSTRQHSIDSTQSYATAEVMTYDALGNTKVASSAFTYAGVSPFPGGGGRNLTNTYDPVSGRLLSEIDANDTGNVTTTHTYDLAGNIERSIHPQKRDRLSYYGADGHLAAVDLRINQNAPGGAIVTQASGADAASMPNPILEKWVFEEYRYDALGRRVWARARRDCKLGTPDLLECETSTLQRTIWDGSQVLIEIRVPGDGSTVDMENDLFMPNLPNDGQNGDPNPFFGRVVYTHGIELDRPLAVTR
jgi:hypothetical protein